MTVWTNLLKEPGAIKDWVVARMVAIRTSFVYVWVTIALVLTWILIHRLHIVAWDNYDLTYLNLTLSVLAEVQGVVLLIYTQRISNKQNEADASRAKTLALIARLEAMHKLARDLEEDVEEVQKELSKE